MVFGALRLVDPILRAASNSVSYILRGVFLDKTGHCFNLKKVVTPTLPEMAACPSLMKGQLHSFAFPFGVYYILHLTVHTASKFVLN